ncbi:MAG: beta strand repeat-containing protein, partial [Mariniblastus sp.]
RFAAGGASVVDTSGVLIIDSFSNSFSSALEWPLSSLTTASNLGGLTLGKVGNTSDITLNSAQTVNGDINVYGGDVAINAGLTATGASKIYIDASGTIVDGASGFVSASEVAIDATGATTLDSTSNAIGTFAFDGKALTLVESDGLTLGTVGSLDGVVSDNTIDIATLTGDLTIGKDIETTNATAAAITLNAGKNTAAGTATGGSVIVTNDAEVTVGSGGTATIYSGDISDSTGLTDLIGSGSGRFRYNSDEAASNFTQAVGSGLNAIYREQPTITVAVDSETVTYGTAPSLTATVGNQNGDSLAQIFDGGGITVGGTTSTSGNYTASSHTLSVSGTGSEQLGYSVGTITGGTLTVNTKAVTTPLVVDSKVYDGTTAAIFSASSNGAVAGDIFAIDGTATFVDKNAGTSKTVNVTGLSLSGTDAANYSLVSTTDTTTADISKRVITYSGLAGQNKVYDGAVEAQIDLSGATTTGVVSGDQLAVTFTGSFADKNVGTGKTINITSALSEADAGNYSLSHADTTMADITAKAVIVEGISVNNRVYDGTSAATIDLSGVIFNGLVSGDDLTAAGTSGTFDNKNVGTNKVVTLSGTTYGGTDVSNYSFTDQATSTGDITQRQFTLGGLAGRDKVYDGSTSAELDISGLTLDGTVSGDDVVVQFSGSFNEKNVGTDQTIVLEGSLLGGDSGNYWLSHQGTVTADITPASVVVHSIVANNKIYDGDTIANVDHSGVVFDGKIAGDSLTAMSTTGTFNNKNVGNSKSVTLAGTVFGGTDVGNYSFTNQVSTTAEITPKSIFVEGIVAVDRVYDGTTAATVDLSGVNFNGMVSGDELLASGTIGVFESKNVGTEQTVNLSGTTYGGIDLGNYSIDDQASTTASISRLDSVAWIGGTTGDWSDASNWAGGAIPDFANVADVFIPDGVTPTFDSAVGGPVTLDNLTGGSLVQDSGTLNVDQTFTGEIFTQNGGVLNADEMIFSEFQQTGGETSVVNDLTVNNSFTQGTEGSVNVGGTANIEQATGELAINNLNGNDVNLISSSGGIKLNNLNVAGDLDVKANGAITQESGNSNWQIFVGGKTTLKTPTHVTLTNESNQFGGLVSVDADQFNVLSSVPFDLTATGDFLEKRSRQAATQSVYDSFVRPFDSASSAQAGSTTSAAVRWYEQLQAFFARVVGRNMIRGVAAQSPKVLLKEDGEVFIRNGKDQ